MHLVEILSRRTVPAAGVTIGLTRRCPLHCAHCSTSSTMSSEDGPEGLIVSFVASFSEADHPEFLAMSGGEVMLRPYLVRDLAAQARSVGTRSMALSGMFFARHGSIPGPVREAISALDHFSVSLDVFHELEVPRVQVFAVLRQLLDDGTDLSVHLCGQDADDPYLVDATTDIQRVFGGAVPMFVNSVSSFGRAREWFVPSASQPPWEQSVEVSPCGSAAWPLVAFDGTVVACGNDDVVLGRPTPAHLRLGHIGSDDWPTIRQRAQESQMLRAIRLLGPEYMADRFGVQDRSGAGYCGTCMQLSSDPGLEERVGLTMTKPAIRLLEDDISKQQVQMGAVAFARRHGVPRFADLVACGATS